MADFGTIQTRVQTLLIDTPTAVQTLTPVFVNWALRKLQVKHNFKVMEAEESYTTTLLTRELGARPTNWKQARGDPYMLWFLGGFSPLKLVSSRRDALARYGNNSDLNFGEPRLLYEDDADAEFEVYPFPDGNSDYADGNYRVVVPYWVFLNDLVNSGDTNWFTTNAEQWLVYQSVAEGFYANEDEERAKIWERRADKEYRDVLLADKDRRFAETETFVPHRGARPPHTQE